MWVLEASRGSWITEGTQVCEAVTFLTKDVYILNTPGGYLHIYLKQLNFAVSVYFLHRSSLHWLKHYSKCSLCVMVPVVYYNSFEYLINTALFWMHIIYSLQNLEFAKSKDLFFSNFNAYEPQWDMQMQIFKN